MHDDPAPAPITPWRRRLLGALLALPLLLQGCASPPSLLGTVTGTGEKTLERQIERLRSDATPVDAPRYIFIGAALNSRERVFDADIRLLDRKFAAQYGTAYRSLLLSNQRIYKDDRDLPLASIDHLDDAFDALEQIKRPQDRFIVLLSSHGGSGMLEVEQPALYRNPRLLSGKKISAWMDQLEPNRSWLIISACYAGSHLPRLTQDHLLTMTAAAANRASFGCSNDFDNTWFVHELATSLDSTEYFKDLWQQTRGRIGMREEKSKLLPSDPRIKVGGDWKEGMDESWKHF